MNSILYALYMMGGYHSTEALLNTMGQSIYHASFVDKTDVREEIAAGTYIVSVKTANAVKSQILIVNKKIKQRVVFCRKVQRIRKRNTFSDSFVSNQPLFILLFNQDNKKTTKE